MVRIPAPADWPNKRVKWIAPCALCCKYFELGDMQVDHIDPIIPVSGWPEAPASLLYQHDGQPDMNVLVYRTFVTADKLQMVCKPCHKAKSKLENIERRKQ